MATRTLTAAGRIVWHDLVAPEAAAVEPFYRELFGWDLGEPEATGYRHFNLDGTTFGGLVERNVHPHWLLYVAVPELESTIGYAMKLGAHVALAPTEIAAGRYALLTDPQGAFFMLFEPAEEEAGPEPAGPHFAWSELITVNGARAIAFYTQLFPWDTVQAPGSGYPVFRLEEIPFADIAEIAKTLDVPPCWIPYVSVEDVDAAAATTKRLGGAIRVAPMTVPNGPHFAVLSDPAGAVFGVFQPR